jgi:zinc protease
MIWPALLATISTSPAAAQVPMASRTMAPVAAITAAADSSTTTYVVDSVRVIHRRTNLSTVVVNVYLLGGVRVSPPGHDGLENLLLQASERGTRRFPRERLRRALARTGSELVIEAREDWTLIGARSTPTELDSTWAMLADRLMYPTLDSTDVEFVRTQLLSALRQRADSPDALLDYLADSAGFAGTAYSRSPVGTESSIAAITREELLAFHREQVVRSRILLVVVGAVDRATVERLIRSSFSALPVGRYRWTMPDTGAPLAGDVVMEPRSLPTNYVQGVFRGPAANHPDAAALRVAAAVLSGRLFGEIRSKRNLTYAVSANYRDRALTSVGLYVTTTLPDSVLALMATELRTLQVFEIQTALLQPIVRQFITEYFLDNETSTAQADFLARTYLFLGDITAGERFVRDVRAVTGADVRRVAQRYLKGARWAYLGDVSRVTRSRFAQF